MSYPCYHSNPGVSSSFTQRLFSSIWHAFPIVGDFLVIFFYGYGKNSAFYQCFEICWDLLSGLNVSGILKNKIFSLLTAIFYIWQSVYIYVLCIVYSPCVYFFSMCVCLLSLLALLRGTLNFHCLWICLSFNSQILLYILLRYCEYFFL